MTATPAAAFRATVTAAGYLLDVPVIGAAEAAARVLTRWQDGAVLRELPDGRWLFTLAAAVEVRADRAPDFRSSVRRAVRWSPSARTGGRCGPGGSPSSQPV